MSSSTTHTKSAAKSASESPESVNVFQRELQKKIRNKQKKLDQINELEQKIKAKVITAKEEQLSKIAAKSAIEAEIAEVKTYLDLYNSTLTESLEKEKKQLKQHQREMNQAKKATVTAVANMMTMHTFVSCG